MQIQARLSCTRLSAPRLIFIKFNAALFLTLLIVSLIPLSVSFQWKTEEIVISGADFKFVFSALFLAL